MSSTEQTHSNDKGNAKQRPPQPAPAIDRSPQPQTLPDTTVPRARLDPRSLAARDVLRLQRLVGNQAVVQLLAKDSARPSRPVIQPKLTVGPAGDGYEQEADRMAEQVMSMSMPAGEQHSAARGQPAVQRAVQDEPEEVQTKPDPMGGFEAGSAIEGRLAARHGGGSPLPDETRAFMEPRFGADFGGVRVHADGEAAQLNRELSAQAFTHGQDVYVGEGRYNPGSTAGKRLLAHELTHVVQQTGAQVRTKAAPLAGAITRRSGTGTIRRWDDNEHKVFGDMAAQMAGRRNWEFAVGDANVNPMGEQSDQRMKDKEKYREKFINNVRTDADTLIPGKKKGVNQLGQEVGHALGNDWNPDNAGTGLVPYKEGGKGSVKMMSLGDASWMAGDFFKTKEDLKGTKTVSPLEFDFLTMAAVAATNTNHFFPLANREWATQYTEAKKEAGEARTAYNQGHKDEGDKLRKRALLTLGFGLHFLEDTFASGHQYPRAMDAVSWKVTTIEKGPPSKTYHDSLCALPGGLDLKYGQKFHGDDYATGQDAPVATECYRALCHILGLISGKEPGEPEPRDGGGPDVPKIMADPEARSVWRSMMSNLEESGEWGSTKLTKETRESPAGTPYNVGKDVWDKVKGWKDQMGGAGAPTTADKLVDIALKGQVAGGLIYAGTKTGETGVGKMPFGGGGDADKIKDLIAKEGVPALTANQAAMVIGALITGYCSFGDQDVVVQILRAGTTTAATAEGAIDIVTPEKIKPYPRIMAAWASKVPDKGYKYIIDHSDVDAAWWLIDKGWINRGHGLAGQLDRLAKDSDKGGQRNAGLRGADAALEWGLNGLTRFGDLAGTGADLGSRPGFWFARRAGQLGILNGMPALWNLGMQGAKGAWELGGKGAEGAWKGGMQGAKGAWELGGKGAEGALDLGLQGAKGAWELGGKGAEQSLKLGGWATGMLGGYKEEVDQRFQNEQEQYEQEKAGKGFWGRTWAGIKHGVRTVGKGIQTGAGYAGRGLVAGGAYLGSGLGWLGSRGLGALGAGASAAGGALGWLGSRGLGAVGAGLSATGGAVGAGLSGLGGLAGWGAGTTAGLAGGAIGGGLGALYGLPRLLQGVAGVTGAGLAAGIGAPIAGAYNKLTAPKKPEEEI